MNLKAFERIDRVVPELLQNRYVGFGFVNKKTYRKLYLAILEAVRWINPEGQLSPRKKGLMYMTTAGVMFIQAKPRMRSNTMRIYEFLSDKKPKVVIDGLFDGGD